MALSYDNSTNGGEGISGGLNWNHVAGGSSILIVALYSDNQSVSINVPFVSGVGTMTAIAQVTGGSASPRPVFMYYIFLPSAATYTIQLTYSNGNVWGYSATYLGQKPSGQPDSFNTLNTTAGSVSTTVVAANCWLVAIASGTTGMAAGSGATGRLNDSGNHITLMDSGGTVGTGSQSLNFSLTISAKAVIISIAPYVPIVYTATLSTGTYGLTGIAAAMSHAYHVALSAGSFVSSGFSMLTSLKFLWKPQGKSATGWSARSKSSTAWTNKTKS